MLITEHDTPAVPSHTTFTTGVNDQMSIAQANDTFKVKAKDHHTLGAGGETLAFGKHQLTVAYDKVSVLQEELAAHEKAAADALASGVERLDLVPVIDELKEQLEKAKSSLIKVVEASSDLFEDKGKVDVGEPDDRSLISRSVASTAVDRLVGLGVVAEEKFGMDENGRVIGLSVQADGAGVRSEVKFPGEDKTRTCFLDVDYSDPRIQRGLHDLEAMDYLTGQIDRHAGNIFIDPHSGRVTGIDNDLSFPDLDREQMFDRSMQLEVKAPVHLPHMMHEETARRIMAITPEALRETLKSIQDPNGQGRLDDRQIGCAVARLERLQQAIRDPGSVPTGFKIVDQFDAATFQEAMAAQDYRGKWSVPCSSYVGTVKCEQLAVTAKVANNSPDHGIITARDVGKALRNAEYAEYARQVELAKAMLSANPAAIADPDQQQRVTGLQQQIADIKEKIEHYDRETARLEAEKPGAMLRGLASGGAAERKEFYSEKKTDALQTLASLERQLDTALDAAVTEDIRKDLRANAVTEIASRKAAEEALEKPAASIIDISPAVSPAPHSATMDQVHTSRGQAMNRIVVKLHQDIDAASGYAAALPQYVSGAGKGLMQKLMAHLPAELRDARGPVANRELQEFISNGPNYQRGEIPINDQTLALREEILEAQLRLDAAYEKLNTLGDNPAFDYSQLDRISVLSTRNEQLDRMLEGLKKLQKRQAALIQQVDALGPVQRLQDSLKPVGQSLQKQLDEVENQLAALVQAQTEKQANLEAIDKLVTAEVLAILVDKKALAQSVAVDPVKVDRSHVRLSEKEIDAAIREHTTGADFPANDVPEYASLAGAIQSSLEPDKTRQHKADKAAIEVRLIETREINPLNQRIEAAEQALEALQQTPGIQPDDPRLNQQKKELAELYEDLDNWETRVDTLKASMRVDDRKNRLDAINADEKVTADEVAGISSSSSTKTRFAPGAKPDDGNPRQAYELKIASADAARTIINRVPSQGIDPATLRSIIRTGYSGAYTYDGPDRFKEDGSKQRIKAANDRGITPQEIDRVAAEMQPMIDQVNALQQDINTLEAKGLDDIQQQIAANPALIADSQTRQNLRQAQARLQAAETTLKECEELLQVLDTPIPAKDLLDPSPEVLEAAAQMEKAVQKHGSLEQARQNIGNEADKARTMVAVAKEAVAVHLGEGAAPIQRQNQAAVADLKAQQDRLLQDFHDQTKAQAATIKPARAQGASVELAHDKVEIDLKAVDAQIAALDAAEAKLQTELETLEKHQADLEQTTRSILAANPHLIANDDTRQAMRQTADQDTQAELYEQLRTREELDRAVVKQDAAAARLDHCEKQLKKLESPSVGDRIKAVAQHGGLNQARQHYQNEIQKAQQAKALAAQEIDQLLSQAADRALAQDPAAVKLGQDIQALRQQGDQLRQQNQPARQSLEQQREAVEDTALAENKVRTGDMLSRKPEKGILPSHGKGEKSDVPKNRVNKDTKDNQRERLERDARLKTRDHLPGKPAQSADANTPQLPAVKSGAGGDGAPPAALSAADLAKEPQKKETVGDSRRKAKPTFAKKADGPAAGDDDNKVSAKIPRRTSPVVSDVSSSTLRQN